MIYLKLLSTIVVRAAILTTVSRSGFDSVLLLRRKMSPRGSLPVTVWSVPLSVRAPVTPRVASAAIWAVSLHNLIITEMLSVGYNREATAVILLFCIAYDVGHEQCADTINLVLVLFLTGHDQIAAF